MAVQINGTTGITTPKLDALDLELGSKNVVERERGSTAGGFGVAEESGQYNAIGRCGSKEQSQ